jgi:hypothetical protein
LSHERVNALEEFHTSVTIAAGKVSIALKVCVLDDKAEAQVPLKCLIKQRCETTDMNTNEFPGVVDDIWNEQRSVR